MFESKDLKILLGNSIKEPEIDYDDAEVQSELGYPVKEEALREYFYVTITDNIGKSNFREEYFSVRPELANYSLKQKQVLADAIIKQLKEKYDFELPINIEVNNTTELDEILELLEFIEFDHENFIVEVWSFLNPDTNSLKLQKYCEQNQDKIISEIEEFLTSRRLPWMIANFLRTYNKENVITWFCEKSQNFNTLILLKLIEGDKNG
jgi:hypothetical protein